LTSIVTTVALLRVMVMQDITAHMLRGSDFSSALRYGQKHEVLTQRCVQCGIA
jgi:hypothetical protein